jgi:hypothetical protein
MNRTRRDLFSLNSYCAFGHIFAILTLKTELLAIVTGRVGAKFGERGC